jgi:hypothetical protein
MVRHYDKYKQFSNAHGIDALLRTYDDIVAHHSKDKVVLNLSWSFKQTKDGVYNNAIKAVSTDLMKAFIDLGNVVVVIAAGNDRPVRPSIFSLPVMVIV